MAEETMPVAEVQTDVDDQEVAHYECAFHILPTVTEEEVPAAVEKIKALITRAGGSITAEEAAEQIDLAYEIMTQIEGMNRRFNAAHFGWVRFTIAPRELNDLNEDIKGTPEVLRHLIVKLTKADLEQPFYLFATRRERERAVTAASADGEEVAAPKATEQAADAPADAPKKVSESDLDDSLEKMTE